jgi:hypothetical protein
LRIPRCCAQHGLIFSNSPSGPWGNKEFIFPTGNLVVAASPAAPPQVQPNNRRERSITMKRLYATMAILLLSGGLAVAQGQRLGPGFNPSNPQDLTNRSNPQDLTLPGASDRQDLVRESVLPKATSPAPSFGNGIRSSPL